MCHAVANFWLSSLFSLYVTALNHQYSTCFHNRWIGPPTGSICNNFTEDFRFLCCGCHVSSFPRALLFFRTFEKNAFSLTQIYFYFASAAFQKRAYVYLHICLHMPLPIQENSGKFITFSNSRKADIIIN